MARDVDQARHLVNQRIKKLPALGAGSGEVWGTDTKA
jgi:hypothetical protein